MTALRGLAVFALIMTLSCGPTLLATLIFGLPVWLPIALGAVMVIYALMTSILGSYDLRTGLGWLALIVDCTWSLPNTIFGTATGAWIYLIFANPSRANSQGRTWVCYLPRSASLTFGNTVLQTLGTINLGGSGQHERFHLLQARIFGPLYLPLFAGFYVLTFVLQLAFTGLLGWILKLWGKRPTAWLTPPARSAVSGYFGWIYYATPFEVWAYAAGNP